MLTLRRAAERGFADHGWLKSRHTFSFADYHDPAHMGFSILRVINEDRIAPGTGFGTHGHRDMEIVSVVLAGALAHKDSLGSGAVLRPGEVQRMSAGRGVMHSEYNAADVETHFLQIWIQPDLKGIAPSYEQKAFDDAGKRGRLQLVASGDARDGALKLHADASLYAGCFDADERAALALADWALLAEGALPLPAALAPGAVPDPATGPLDSCCGCAMLPGGTTTFSVNGIGRSFIDNTVSGSPTGAGGRGTSSSAGIAISGACADVGGVLRPGAWKGLGILRICFRSVNTRKFGSGVAGGVKFGGDSG